MSIGSSTLSQNEIIEAAAVLARQIHEHRTYAKDGSVTWLGPWNPPLGEPVRLMPVGPHLYSGAAGIALFLAALYHTTGGSEHRELALHAIAPLRRKFTDIGADPAHVSSLKISLGGIVGLGAFVYSFRKIGAWLGEPELVQETHQLMALFTEDRIARDDLSDVIAGAAGAILALLAAAKEDSGVSPALSLAIACARRLLSNRSGDEGQPRGWRTLPGYPPLSGFGHGAAGICNALLHLYEKTREPELLEAVQEGLAFERRLYSPAHRNWRDMRAEELRFMTSWCHGAPGIALGRLGTLHILDSPEVREEICVALETTQNTSLAPLDHVCCGNMGRADILLYASRRLGDRKLLDAAYQIASQVVHRAESRGRYSWVLDPESNTFDPSFFTGASGVGYTFLRFAYPESLPCVLLLE
jgi:type 2 lantibiotic biosynthesis protein LanM